MTVTKKKPRLTKIRCRVTKNDIKFGACQNPEACAVARSLNRRLKEPYLVAVTPDSFYIKTAGEVWTLFSGKLNLAIQAFIKDFDSYIEYKKKRLRMKPTSFTVELPTRFLKNV